MIKARIAPDFLADGIAVRVTEEGDGHRMLLHYGEDGSARWRPFEPQPGLDPGITMTLTDEAARVLLDALLRHYEGASDMRTVRSDLLHERDRVDRLIKFIQDIIIQAAQR